jgi:glycosyltransferase involved in cell wall biosynthesis
MNDSLLRASPDPMTTARLGVLQVGMHERESGGGVDRFFWDLFDELGRFPDLASSAFFFQHRSGAIAERPSEFCLGTTSLSGSRRLWRLRRKVLSELASKTATSPVLVASHFALFASALLPQLWRHKHVVHFHGPWSIESAVEGKNRLNVALKQGVERAVYSTAGAFITLSHAFCNLLIQEYRLDPELVHVIPPGVDLKRFTLGKREQARELLGWPPDATILICVRRLVRRMGLETLIEAFRAVSHLHPQALLFLGGTGPLRDELAARIESYGLSKRVCLLGFIPDDRLAAAYQAADLSIIPTQSLEGFGLSSLESLACGTPVLVTPVGGLPESLSGFAPQLVLSDRSATALAEGLDFYFRGKLPVPSPEQCRRHVETNFNWQKAASATRAVYLRVANA